MSKFLFLLIAISASLPIIRLAESNAATQKLGRPSCWIEIRGNETETSKVFTTCHRWSFKSAGRSTQDEKPFDIWNDYIGAGDGRNL